MRRLLIVLLLAGVSVLGAAGQHASDPLFELALDAWDAGDYPAALKGFRTVLSAPDSERYFERIATLTGELFEVTELAVDGRSVRFSPDGRYAAFDIGTRADPRTRVVDVEGSAGRSVDLEGTGLVFSPVEPKVAFLRVRTTPEIARLREQVDRLSRQAAPDRQGLANTQRTLASLEAAGTEIVVRDLMSSQEHVLPDGGLGKAALAFSADGSDVYLVGGRQGETASSDLFAIKTTSGALRPLTAGPGLKSGLIPVAGGRVLVYAVALLSGQGPPPGESRGGFGGGGAATTDVVVLNLADRTTTTFKGTAPVVSADGSTLAFLVPAGGHYTVQVVRLTGDGKPATVKQSPERIGSVALSPDGSRVVFDAPHTRNREIFCTNADGTGEVRVSREVQDDRAPRFVGSDRILAIKGEERHSRAYLYRSDRIHRDAGVPQQHGAHDRS